MSKPNGDDEIITINVGGRHFTTFKVLKFFIQKFLLQSSQIFFSEHAAQIQSFNPGENDFRFNPNEKR